MSTIINDLELDIIETALLEMGKQSKDESDKSVIVSALKKINGARASSSNKGIRLEVT